VRIVSWNICHGGGQRAPHIIRQLQEWRPDVLGLIEFRGTQPSQHIRQAILDMGLIHMHSTVPEHAPKQDGLVLASRYPIEVIDPCVFPAMGRWIHASLPQRHLHLVHFWVPNRDSGCKYEFHRSVVETLGKLSSRDALAFGDSNTGVPKVDEQASYFNALEGEWFTRLEEAGWGDLWRSRYPDGREFTWYNHGSSAGFRLDQAFATASVNPRVQSIRHDWGTPKTGKLRGPSDHAALIIDLHQDTSLGC
jgi:exonuclease III